MNTNTLKDILLPFAAIFTICPIGLALMAVIVHYFGPLSIIFVIFGIGVLSLIGYLLVVRYERRKAKEAADGQA